MCHLKKVFVWEVQKTNGKDKIPEQPKQKNRVGDALKDIKNDAIIKPAGSVYDNWKKIPQTEIDKPLEETLKRINPNVGKGVEYDCNCVHCVAACEFLFRGYDVSAKPCYNLATDASADLTKVFVGANYSVKLVGNGKNECIRKLAEWGDNSRAAIHVTWNSGENKGLSHVFMGRFKNGKIQFFDPQNAISDANHYFNDVVEHNVYIMRIDDKEVSELISDCCFFKEE